MAGKNAIVSFCRMKCPACRTGEVFSNRSVFPLSKCLEFTDECKCCGQPLNVSTNSGGGINYALTMLLFFLNIFWYWPLFGLSYKDNSFIYFLFTSISVVVLVQPWLMRYSRIIFLYFIIRYKPV